MTMEPGQPAPDPSLEFFVLEPKKVRTSLREKLNETVGVARELKRRMSRHRTVSNLARFMPRYHAAIDRANTLIKILNTPVNSDEELLLLYIDRIGE